MASLLCTIFILPLAIEVLKVLVMALGAGLAVWGVVNLLEGYGSDNPFDFFMSMPYNVPEPEQSRHNCGMFTLIG